jgi:hypothetical protein
VVREPLLELLLRAFLMISVAVWPESAAEEPSQAAEGYWEALKQLSRAPLALALPLVLVRQELS